MRLTGVRVGVGVAMLLLPSLLDLAGEPGDLDEGRLDPAWFGAEFQFSNTAHFDYVWVKPGYSIQGKRLRVATWPDPVFPGRERRGRDMARAYELTESMPLRIRSVLRQALRGVAEVTADAPDQELSGRVVDYVSKGTFAESFPKATWDLKVTDLVTGELHVAVHHRVVASLSTVEERVDRWLEKFGEALRDDMASAGPGKPATP